MDLYDKCNFVGHEALRELYCTAIVDYMHKLARFEHIVGNRMDDARVRRDYENAKEILKRLPYILDGQSANECTNLYDHIKNLWLKKKVHSLIYSGDMEDLKMADAKSGLPSPAAKRSGLPS